MLNFVLYTIIVSLVASFVLCLMRKWEIIEYVQIHGNLFFHKMFSCDFCLSWWVSVLLAIVIFLATGNVRYLLIPFCSTTLTRILL